MVWEITQIALVERQQSVPRDKGNVRRDDSLHKHPVSGRFSSTENISFYFCFVQSSLTTCCSSMVMVPFQFVSKVSKNKKIQITSVKSKKTIPGVSLVRIGPFPTHD